MSVRPWLTFFFGPKINHVNQNRTNRGYIYLVLGLLMLKKHTISSILRYLRLYLFSSGTTNVEKMHYFRLLMQQKIHYSEYHTIKKFTQINLLDI